MDVSKTGELIRRLRIEKGLTQRELADLICVSDKAVSKWECGNGMPDLSILPNLSKVFDASQELIVSHFVNAKTKQHNFIFIMLEIILNHKRNYG